MSHIESQSLRWAVVGGSWAGVVGAIVGLVIGLYAYAPTAPFAMVELGLPAAIAGGVIGLLSWALLAVVSLASQNWRQKHDTPRTDRP